MRFISGLTSQSSLLFQGEAGGLFQASQSTIEDVFKSITFYLASGVEAAAALMIGLAAIEGTCQALLLFFIKRSAPDKAKDDIRLRFGRWLVVGLEFELGADILRTAIAPTWNEIGLLAAIVILRTTLNYFLQKEIAKASLET